MQLLAILGAVQGLVLFFFFVTIKKNRAANINMLIGILLSIAQMLLVFYVENPFVADGPILLKLLTRVLVFPIPVFFYFYFRFMITGAQSYRTTDLLHALPFLLAVGLAFCPYLNLGEPKALLTKGDSLAFAKEGFYFLSAQSLLIILYAKVSFYSIFDLEINVWDTYAHLLERELNWFSGAISGIFLVGFSGMICSAFGFRSMMESGINSVALTNYLYPIFGVVSLTFYWIGYKATRQPEIFRNLEHVATTKTTSKYQHSNLQEEVANELAKQLSNLMDREQIYLDANLKLSDVAATISISDKKLSQLLNQHFGQNFYDFINGYRLATAKEKLVDAELAHLTIQGIAIESGFKSKSTFYSLFKKQTGLTPTQFQKITQK